MPLASKAAAAGSRGSKSGDKMQTESWKLDGYCPAPALSDVKRAGQAPRKVILTHKARRPFKARTTARCRSHLKINPACYAAAPSKEYSLPRGFITQISFHIR